MGEGVLASFDEVEEAVRTALDLVPRPGGGQAPHALRLRVGIHRGTTLAATLNDQLDYFGTTARQAVGTLQYARGGELVLTQPVAADPAVAALLNARHIEGELVRGRADRATTPDPGADRFPFPTRMNPSYPDPCRVFPHPPYAITADLLRRDRCSTRIKISTCQIFCEERRLLPGSGGSLSSSPGSTRFVPATATRPVRPASMPTGYNPPIAPASDEAKRAIRSFRVPAGLKRRAVRGRAAAGQPGGLLHR